MITYQSACFFVAKELFHTLLEFVPEIESVYFKTWCSFQPLLQQIRQRRILFGLYHPFRRLGICAKRFQIVLIVFDTMLWLYAQLVFDQAKLKTLKTGRIRKVISEVHEVQRRHGFQDRNLINQQLH